MKAARLTVDPAFRVGTVRHSSVAPRPNATATVTDGALTAVVPSGSRSVLRLGR